MDLTHLLVGSLTAGGDHLLPDGVADVLGLDHLLGLVVGEGGGQEAESHQAGCGVLHIWLR